jgi:hypothetical protein
MEPRHHYYDANVKFIGDYFVINVQVKVSVDADESDLSHNDILDRAVLRANLTLQDYYGWDVESVSNDVEVDLSDGY